MYVTEGDLQPPKKLTKAEKEKLKREEAERKAAEEGKLH